VAVQAFVLIVKSYTDSGIIQSFRNLKIGLNTAKIPFLPFRPYRVSELYVFTAKQCLSETKNGFNNLKDAFQELHEH
jgi:hypothetical protein